MNLIPRVSVLLVALCAFASAPLLSQTPASQTKALTSSSGEGYVMLTFTTVKPDRASEFERLQKEELNPALKKAGVTRRFASTRATVGDAYTYVFGTPLANFAELDQESRLTGALGQEKANALLEKLRACHVSSRTVVVRNIPDLSWGLDTPMPYFVVTAIQLANGKKAEWLKYQREVAPAQRKSGLATYVVQETIYGGDNNMVYTLRRFDRFAELDSNPLRQHMGEEAYNALVAKRPVDAVVRLERTLARHRTDLSIVPTMTASNAADPWLGTWLLNLSKTRVNPGPKPRSETRTYTSTPNGEHATYDLVDADGKRIQSSSTYYFDGKDAKLLNDPNEDSMAITRAGPRSITAVVKKDGKVIRTATREVSTDGKTLTVQFKGANAKGQPIIEEVWVFDRK